MVTRDWSLGQAFDDLVESTKAAPLGCSTQAALTDATELARPHVISLAAVPSHVAARYASQLMEFGVCVMEETNSTRARIHGDQLRKKIDAWARMNGVVEAALV